MNLISALAIPLSWLYGLGTEFRNLLYDSGICFSKSYGIPVISVGNIAVGGTGKTPHTEYLIRLLKDSHQVCVLSRGYRRRSKGFQLATPHSTADQLGDEPMQMYSKFHDVRIAVDVDRCHGIDRLINGQEDNGNGMVILLDDAFQHRKVKPGLNILLTDYCRPLYSDRLMPSGRLREAAHNADRADIIVVTKCPEHLSQDEQDAIRHRLHPSGRQHLFFSTFSYSSLPQNTRVLLVTGIANPHPLEDRLRLLGNNVLSMKFADHHHYTQNDIETIMQKSTGRTIVTTEKDAVKLKTFEAFGLNPTVASIEVRFLNNQQIEFNKIIQDYANTGIR